MAFNVFGFLIGGALADREGVVDPASRNRVALVGGVVGPSATGLVVTSALARREAESIPSVSPPPAELALVPDFTGQSAADAGETAAKAGLIISVVEVRSISSDGLVIDQAPPPDSRVAVGSTVTLFVGKVVQPPQETRVPVPDVTNLPFSDARETLQDEDFKVTKRTESSPIVPKDSVIKTEPPANTLVEHESRVTVVVSSGPEVVTPGSQDIKAKR